MFKWVSKLRVHRAVPQDLYKPDPKTVRRTLSAIINFAKFREEKVCTYEELREASEAAAEKRTQLQQENAQLVRLVNFREHSVIFREHSINLIFAQLKIKTNRGRLHVFS
jgi:hypothetical protein